MNRLSKIALLSTACAVSAPLLMSAPASASVAVPGNDYCTKMPDSPYGANPPSGPGIKDPYALLRPKPTIQQEVDAKTGLPGLDGNYRPKPGEHIQKGAYTLTRWMTKDDAKLPKGVTDPRDAIKDVPRGDWCRILELNTKDLKKATGPWSDNRISGNQSFGDGKGVVVQGKWYESGLPARQGGAPTRGAGKGGSINFSGTSKIQLRAKYIRPVIYTAHDGKLAIIYEYAYQVRAAKRVEANSIILWANDETFDPEAGWKDVPLDTVKSLASSGVIVPEPT